MSTGQIPFKGVNDKTYWMAQLAGKPIALKSEIPEYGFYRTLNPDKTNWIVWCFYFNTASELIVLRNGDRFEDQTRACEIWKWACENAITRDQYTDALSGKPWGDIPKTSNSNFAPDDDSFEALSERIADLTREAEALIAKGAAKSQEEANLAANLVDRISKLEKRATAQRKALKAPIKAKMDSVDSLWMPIAERAESAFKRLKAAVIDPFLKRAVAEKAQREAEARAEMEKAAKLAREKEEEAQRALDAAARSANEEAEAKAHQAAMAAAEAKREAEQATQTANMVARETVTAGTMGRSIGLRGQKSYAIGDKDKMVAFFADNAQYITEHEKLLLRLGTAADKAGVVVPGLTVTSTDKAA